MESVLAAKYDARWRNNETVLDTDWQKFTNFSPLGQRGRNEQICWELNLELLIRVTACGKKLFRDL